MQIVLNRFTARLLLILLWPIAMSIRLYEWITGTAKKKPIYVSTLEGDPLLYSGERPLVVALWAPWLSVWSAATEKIVQDLQAQFKGQCEFVYVEVTSPSVEEKFEVDNTPAVLVYHHGRKAGCFINLLEADELRECIAQKVSVNQPTVSMP